MNEISAFLYLDTEEDEILNVMKATCILHFEFLHIKMQFLIITSIATRPIGLHAILVITFLLTFKTVVIKSPK
jgi:hypothetical protein